MVCCHPNVLAWATAHPDTVALFPWVWNPGDKFNHVLSGASDYYGSHPTAWGEQYRNWTVR